MVKAAWYPKALKMDQGTTGGTMTGGTPRGVIHTTETAVWAGQANYHIQFMEVQPGVVVCKQYRPFNKASRALRNRPLGVQTNRQGSVNINVCIVGYAADAPNRGAFTDAMYEALGNFAVWAREEWDIPMQFMGAAPTGGSECYGYDSPCRMSFTQWRTNSGWCGHQNVPEQTHWDPGKFDWTKFMEAGNNMTEAERALLFSLERQLENQKAINQRQGGYINGLQERVTALEAEHGVVADPVDLQPLEERVASLEVGASYFVPKGSKVEFTL